MLPSFSEKYAASDYHENYLWNTIYFFDQVKTHKHRRWKTQVGKAKVQSLEKVSPANGNVNVNGNG